MRGGDVDDAAEFARLHSGEDGLGRVERRREIDGDDGVPLLVRKIFDRGHMLDAGIVDEDVHRADPPLRRRDEGPDPSGFVMSALS